MGISATNLIVILVIVILLFGSKKIPELAKGVGQGIKVFKKEIESVDEPAKKEEVAEETKVEAKEETKA
ncbi:MAG: twin-arginine translocase TatA/TatE family subunit [Campylobacteraceae bacterium]|nr:twin-arginine translocase TatA/TatE family subunit [Campylobacteraceae bacterium]